jgi:hypothetical protein
MTFSDISDNLAASIPTHHDLRAPDEADAHTIKVKAARSRFILLEQLSKHDQIAHLNWADILPPVMRVTAGGVGDGHDQISTQKVVPLGFFNVPRFCHASVTQKRCST